MDAAAIHANVRQSQREKALAEFSAVKIRVLVATDVAARGIHIGGDDCVIHFDRPEYHKAYLHRSGRTARAGSKGVIVAILLWNQIAESGVLMKRLALKLPVIEVFSNNKNFANWRLGPQTLLSPCC